MRQSLLGNFINVSLSGPTGSLVTPAASDVQEKHTVLIKWSKIWYQDRQLMKFTVFSYAVSFFHLSYLDRLGAITFKCSTHIKDISAVFTIGFFLSNLHFVNLFSPTISGDSQRSTFWPVKLITSTCRIKSQVDPQNCNLSDSLLLIFL